jgi:dUTP pyrophosphatase
MFNVQVIARSPEYIPAKKHASDAGYDLKAYVPADNNSAVAKSLALALGDFLCEQAFLERPARHTFAFFLDGTKVEVNLDQYADSMSLDPESIKATAQAIADQYVFGEGADRFKGRVALEPGETKLVSTGVQIKMSEAPVGWNNVIQLYPRSGLGIKCNLVLANSVGIVDQGYINQELGLGLVNQADLVHIISDQARVAQAIFTRVLHVDSFEVVDAWDLDSDRGGGFGSTGVS